MLQMRIGEPLAAVQTLLQRDKVVWSSGVLATPPVRAQFDSGGYCRKALPRTLSDAVPSSLCSGGLCWT